MKIVLFSNDAGILPVADYLYKSACLQAIISTDKLQGYHLQVKEFCSDRGISFYKVSKENLAILLKDIFSELKPDAAIMLSFSYKIPKEIFCIPSKGFFNVHFSLLPSYKGPNPLYWQIRNGEKLGGITIHLVDSEFDTGAAVMRQEIPFIAGENWGLCNARYMAVAFNMLVNMVTSIKDNAIQSIPLSSVTQASYFPKPKPEEFIIFWDKFSADDVESLVNACNPLGGGAIAFLNHQLIRILEVSPVDGNGDPSLAPGTVIHVDYSGLYVQCADLKLVRINIVSFYEGAVMSGFKLLGLGVKKGDMFSHPDYKLKLQAN